MTSPLLSISGTSPLGYNSNDAMQIYYGHKKAMVAGNGTSRPPSGKASTMVANFRQQISVASSMGENVSVNKASALSNIPTLAGISKVPEPSDRQVLGPSSKPLNPRHIRDSMKLPSNAQHMASRAVTLEATTSRPASASVGLQTQSTDRASSASKRVRFASELCTVEQNLHSPMKENTLPLVSVLKTSTTVVSQANVAKVTESVMSVVPNTATPVRQPIPPVGTVVKAKPFVRPSLSEQLAAIGANASALTQDIRTKAGLDKGLAGNDAPLFTVPAKCFTVGALNCRYPSPVRFHNDRVEYTFHHPFESAEIRMVMYYRDMIGPSIVASKLRFKLPRALTHFPSDFDPSNPQHLITVEFTSTSAASSVRMKLAPFLMTLSGPR